MVISQLVDPLLLIASIAHELGHYLLAGKGRIKAISDDYEAIVDLLTIILGMGVFTSNAVIRENYWSAGAVAGWKMSLRGHLAMPVHGYAHALFAQLRGEERPAWAKELRGDVRAPFEQSMRFVRETSNTLLASRRLQD